MLIITTAYFRNNSVPDDNFLDQLLRCQGSRLEDQRSALPVLPVVDSETDSPTIDLRKEGATVPDEDFFSLIMRFQSGRMDDQRAAVPRIDLRFVLHILLERKAYILVKIKYIKYIHFGAHYKYLRAIFYLDQQFFKRNCQYDSKKTNL